MRGPPYPPLGDTVREQTGRGEAAKKLYFGIIQRSARLLYGFHRLELIAVVRVPDLLHVLPISYFRPSYQDGITVRGNLEVVKSGLGSLG